MWGKWGAASPGKCWSVAFRVAGRTGPCWSLNTGCLQSKCWYEGTAQWWFRKSEHTLFKGGTYLDSFVSRPEVAFPKNKIKSSLRTGFRPSCPWLIWQGMRELGWGGLPLIGTGYWILGVFPRVKEKVIVLQNAVFFFSRAHAKPFENSLAVPYFLHQQFHFCKKTLTKQKAISGNEVNGR